MTGLDFTEKWPKQSYTTSSPLTCDDIEAAREAGWWVGFAVGLFCSLGGVLLGAVVVWLMLL